MCAAGQFKATVGDGGCVLCSNGQFQDVTGATSCKQCSVHTYQNDAGTAACKPCDYSCPAGEQHSTCAGNTPGGCFACSAGQYRAAVQTMPWGHNPSCLSCPTGRYSSAGQSDCTECDGVTQWQDVSGQGACKTVAVCSATQQQCTVTCVKLHSLICLGRQLKTEMLSIRLVFRDSSVSGTQR